MGDLHCNKCSEPWDAWGVYHGDMTSEEKERFLRGEGCPCCKFGEKLNGKEVPLWKVVEAFQYAVCQAGDQTTRRVIAQEFVHCLNRRGVLSNGETEALEEQVLKAVTNAIYVPIE